jgi:ATP-binding cassette, subfamily B, bacterial HlyB/CyaB
MSRMSVDSGLRALCGLSAYYRIPADPAQLSLDLALQSRRADTTDLVRAANRIGLKARILTNVDASRLASLPTPALLKLRTGEFVVLGGRNPAGLWRVVDPVTHADRFEQLDALHAQIEPLAILVGRRMGGAGIDPRSFGFRWFLPSIWRYRKPLMHVLIASLFIQVFALVTPLFFQVIVDKVLAHKSNATLLVMIAGIAVIGLFDVILQYLRSYALSHTTNRIDVELGRRLFHHLLQLPLQYFETRPAGQTVARVRELENIRQFLTGQGLSSVLDLVFTFVFFAVLLIYSWKLTLIIMASIPVYLVVAALLRPPLRETLNEKFNRCAESQQFLVEAVVGVHTVKSAAVEPVMQTQWEEKLAAYVRSGFFATMIAAGGQNAIQYVNRVTTALILLFGAWAVMDGDLTVGGLIAFNMIAGQTVQPILRLSQLWQDFQQVQVSVERLGDILNSTPEYRPRTTGFLPPPRGLIEMKNVSFRYRPGAPEVLKNVSLEIRPGEVIGVVGPSGSGKSTLSKLIQRLYGPNEGAVLLDGTDLSQADPGWVRRNIGVVLQENILFNRSIHDNIAFSNPSLDRAQVIAIAKLSGAHEFIAQLPAGYDTLIEERGANLSGGQRQRIAIARALALNPPILIFDEATSALDYESERIVQANMTHIAKNRTVIIIAHRLAALRPCNRIYGIVGGRIVEEGSHDELMKMRGGFYAHLWALQNGQAVHQVVPEVMAKEAA